MSWLHQFSRGCCWFITIPLSFTKYSENTCLQAFTSHHFLLYFMAFYMRACDFNIRSKHRTCVSSLCVRKSHIFSTWHLHARQTVWCVCFLQVDLKALVWYAAFCTDLPLHVHTCLFCWCYMLCANPLIHPCVCRLVPVSAPWQPGVWGPCEDCLFILFRLIITRNLLLLQGPAHSQWAAGERGRSPSSRIPQCQHDHF